MNDNPSARILCCPEHHFHRLVIQRIGLAVKFNQPDIAIELIYRCSMITFQTGCILAHHRKTHHPIRQADRLISCICDIYLQKLVSMVIGSAAFLQRLWHGDTCLFCYLFQPVCPDSINHLKRPPNPVKSELHRIINILRGAGNLWHQPCSIT